jgi:membrane-bound inhibitor of C-type lysozyme
MRLALSTALVAALAASAHAEALTIDLPDGAPAERNKVAYSCTGGHKLTAEYINAGSNSLAVVTTGDKTILMTSVLSASGARYAGLQYVWWTKGNTGDFYDLTQGEDAPPQFSCEEE